jgi:phosphohistidine swiveling domain-containing protein
MSALVITRDEADGEQPQPPNGTCHGQRLLGVFMTLLDSSIPPPSSRRATAVTRSSPAPPASSGSATVWVTVIRQPTDFGRLAPGDVLVCPYTNPLWTTLFQRAAAVVVDSGRPASHAAIVAREYGIPAVMGTQASQPPTSGPSMS